jgi:hypothetical protein
MKIRALSALIAVAVVTVVVGACGTTKPAKLQVNTDYDKDVRWTEMKSFRMTSSTSGGSDQQRYPRLERMVAETLVEQLVGRGFERTEDGPTDFRVTFELTFRGDDRPAPGTTPQGVDGQPAVAAGPGQTSALAVRMLDPDTSEILWEGRVVGFSVGAANQESDMRKAVWRILVEFPPITG